MPNKLLVIDSDTPAFAAAISCEEYDYVDSEGYHYKRMSDVPPELHDEVKQCWSTNTPPHFAVARCDKYLQGILDDASEYISGDFDYICLVGVGDNYRYDLPCTTGFPYKGNRAALHTPEYLKICKDAIVDKHPCVPCDGYEADDGCGIIMSQGVDGYDELILAHIDKDMDMISGKHLRWKRVINGKTYPASFYEITPVEGLRKFYAQLLKGDNTDNIPGYYKLTGKKLMKRILEPLETMTSEYEMWNYVRNTYRKAGLRDLNLLREIGRLLWIQKEEGQLWEFPSM